MTFKGKSKILGGATKNGKTDSEVAHLSRHQVLPIRREGQGGDSFSVKVRQKKNSISV